MSRYAVHVDYPTPSSSTFRADTLDDVAELVRSIIDGADRAPDGYDAPMPFDRIVVEATS